VIFCVLLKLAILTRISLMPGMGVSNKLEKSGLRPFFQDHSFVAAGKKRGFCRLPRTPFCASSSPPQ
jgi:hypothetical protein